VVYAAKVAVDWDRNRSRNFDFGVIVDRPPWQEGVIVISSVTTRLIRACAFCFDLMCRTRVGPTM